MYNKNISFLLLNVQDGILALYACFLGNPRYSNLAKIVKKYYRICYVTIRKKGEYL